MKVVHVNTNNLYEFLAFMNGNNTSVKIDCKMKLEVLK